MTNVIISAAENPSYTGNLSTADGFYRVEAYNLSTFSSSITYRIALTTVRPIDITFANSGNATGVVLIPICVGATMTDRNVIVSLNQKITPITVSIATPAVVSNVAHGLSINNEFYFTTTGALPTGISLLTPYYVIAAGFGADAFEFSATLGGAAVNTSGSQSGVHSLWATKATCTKTPAQIAGTNMSGTYNYNGLFITPFVFTTPYAVTGGLGSTYRIYVRHGTGTGTWNLVTSDAANASYAVWCDNKVSYTSGDSFIIKDSLTIDQSATFNGLLGTGDTTYGYAGWICANVADQTAANVCLLKWQNPPTSAYTLTLKGTVVMGSFSGFRVGGDYTKTFTVNIANPANFYCVGHGLVANQMVSLDTTGALPTGFVTTRGVYYYVKTVVDVDNFTLSATVGGAAIESTGTQSGVHTVHYGRIPAAQKATITWSARSVGTVEGGFSAGMTSTDAYNPGFQNLFLYGQIPLYEKTTLTADAAINQKVLACADSVNWANGDRVIIGRQDVKGLGVTTVHTVDSVAGANITLTTNLATNTRKSGGTVLRVSSSATTGYGVKFQHDTSISNSQFGLPANFTLSGVEFYDVYLYGPYGYIYIDVFTALNTALTSQYLIEDCVMWGANGGTGMFRQILVPPKGCLFNRVYAHLTGFVNLLGYFADGIFTSGTIEIKNGGSFNGNNTGTFGKGTGSLDPVVSMHDCTFENSTGSTNPLICLTGKSSSFYNNYIWGDGRTTAYGAVNVVGYFNSVNVGNNYYDNCACAMLFNSYTTKNVIDTDSKFGTIAANTVDISYLTGALIDYQMVSPTGNLVFDDTYLSFTLVGTNLRIRDFNDTTNDDRCYFTYGKIQRTGDGLADTTCHTVAAGKFAMRFSPNTTTTAFTYDIIIPTGNINTKSMSIAVWVKISNAAYYAGTNQLPRMTVNYDNGTTTYVQATATTDWQQLLISFVPVTSYGQITITLSCQTDAATANGYVYWDDFSVLYPTGYTLDLGGLDLWANGLPVNPPIATMASSGSVWDELTVNHIGSGTFGQSNQLINAGAVVTSATTSVTLASGASSVNDYYMDDIIVITSGLGQGQARRISAYNGTSKIATIIRAWSTLPDTTSVYVILPFFSIENAVWEAANASHVTTATMGALVDKIEHKVDDSVVIRGVV